MEKKLSIKKYNEKKKEALEKQKALKDKKDKKDKKVKKERKEVKDLQKDLHKALHKDTRRYLKEDMKKSAAGDRMSDAAGKKQHRYLSAEENPARDQEQIRVKNSAEDLGQISSSETEYESRIEGRNAVIEAYRAGKTIDRLYVLEDCQDGAVLTIKRAAAKAGTPVKYLSRQRLDQMSETGHHQGVIASVAVYHYSELQDLFEIAQRKGEDPFFILLDKIEDPHNLGAIIRTANVVGAHGVIIPKDRAVGLTAVVAKASAGAINFTPVVKVTNLSETIQELKKQGLWFVCADMDGTPMTRLNMTGPIGLVIGAEGEGVSRLVKENCDIVASIPQQGEINSLNASVAMGVLSYEIRRQRNH